MRFPIYGFLVKHTECARWYCYEFQYPKRLKVDVRGEIIHCNTPVTMLGRRLSLFALCVRLARRRRQTLPHIRTPGRGTLAAPSGTHRAADSMPSKITTGGILTSLPSRLRTHFPMLTQTLHCLPTARMSISTAALTVASMDVTRTFRVLGTFERGAVLLPLLFEIKGISLCQFYSTAAVQTTSSKNRRG